MKTFILQIRDSTHCECFEDVTSFVGEDASGKFGILADHARMITMLDFGLARFKGEDDNWQYLAMPGAALYFSKNELRLNTQRFVYCKNYQDIDKALQETLLSEESMLGDLKTNLKSIESTMLQRISRLSSSNFNNTIYDHER